MSHLNSGDTPIFIHLRLSLSITVIRQTSALYCSHARASEFELKHARRLEVSPTLTSATIINLARPNSDYDLRLI